MGINTLIQIPYVTGFWKTDWIVILGLFHFSGPANGCTCTLHIHSAITKLCRMVCFSRASFDDPVNSLLRQRDPWGYTWNAWVWNSSSDWGDISYAIQTYLGIWLALLGPIASQNYPKGEFNPPLASHSPLHLPFPYHPPNPIVRDQWYYSGFEKSCWKSSSVSQLAELAIKC